MVVLVIHSGHLAFKSMLSSLMNQLAWWISMTHSPTDYELIAKEVWRVFKESGLKLHSSAIVDRFVPVSDKNNLPLGHLCVSTKTNKVILSDAIAAECGVDSPNILDHVKNFKKGATR